MGWEQGVRQARQSLVWLWFSQVARIVADNALRMAIVLRAAQAGANAADAAWNLAAVLFVLPAFLLAPVNGAICNGLPRQRVLVGAAGWCLAVSTATCLLFAYWSSTDIWLACLVLAAIGNAIYSPARYGMLPAAAHDSHWPLTRVNGWIEMGSVGAIIVGFMVGGALFPLSSPFGAAWPTILLGIVACNALGLLTALPVAFPSDVIRPEPPLQALAGFFRDTRRIFALPETRGYLLALAGLRGLVLAVTGPMLAVCLSHLDAGTDSTPVLSLVSITSLIGIATLILLGAGAGSLLAGIEGHPTRSLGQVPFAVTGFLAGLAVAGLLQAAPWWLCLWIGAMGGIINVPLFAAYQAALPADARGNGIAILNTTGYACMAVLSLAMHLLAGAEILSATGRLWLLVLLAAGGAVLAWKYLRRDAWELAVELTFLPMYRVRGTGPGLELPRTGPLLILANHAAWFDPIWLGQVLPRRMTGMLTSTFFDKPILRFLGTYVVPTIRVAHSSYRREAPELHDAIAALDRGEAVLIFPEGQMRKREERALFHFGRGVWHILKDRPGTPVVVCWIEGGWGSYASYWNGPPTRNKSRDWRRPIDVAATAPQVLDAEVLADHRKTREHLMHACLEARRLLGLEPLEAKAKVEAEPEGEE